MSNPLVAPIARYDSVFAGPNGVESLPLRPETLRPC